eukprot:comp12702_c0_seq1/m.7801 comp12702_c0_seq1/g.7801  ORF comp12702_c0_seq1/g.7801 comp12702_c0_seq1/m.7801 type:complete len:333 (-) comp12702_c0_seq1:43-1041(-)
MTTHQRFQGRAVIHSTNSRSTTGTGGLHSPLLAPTESRAAVGTAVLATKVVTVGRQRQPTRGTLTARPRTKSLGVKVRAAAVPTTTRAKADSPFLMLTNPHPLMTAGRLSPTTTTTSLQAVTKRRCQIKETAINPLFPSQAPEAAQKEPTPTQTMGQILSPALTVPHLLTTASQATTILPLLETVGRHRLFHCRAIQTACQARTTTGTKAKVQVAPTLTHQQGALVSLLSTHPLSPTEGIRRRAGAAATLGLPVARLARWEKTMGAGYRGCTLMRRTGSCRLNTLKMTMTGTTGCRRGPGAAVPLVLGSGPRGLVAEAQVPEGPGTLGNGEG